MVADSRHREKTSKTETNFQNRKNILESRNLFQNPENVSQLRNILLQESRKKLEFNNLEFNEPPSWHLLG